MTLVRLVQREREMQRLSSACDDAENGQGGLWLLTGEPGIGKSRLAEELARAAAARAFEIAWGRCWESGGAPAFWPWNQVVRSLWRDDAEERQRHPMLHSLFAEHPEAAPPSRRFDLFDAVAQWVRERSGERPLCLLLEDLHAADTASLALLEALVPPLRSSRCLIVGTARDAAIRSGALAQLYGRLCRQAQILALNRLDKASAKSILSEVLGEKEPAIQEAAAEAADGLPLFVVEVGLLARNTDSTAELSERIPATLSNVLIHRLEELSADGIAVLSWAALCGKDLDRALIERHFGSEQVASAIREGLQASVIEGAGNRAFRFSHALVRDALMEAMTSEQRAKAHGDIADLMVDDDNHASRAFHLFHAGEGREIEAIEVTLRAARHCLDRFAFEDAQAHLSRARHAANQTPRTSPRVPGLRAEIEVLEGLSRIGLGEVDEGRAACAVAADLARSIDDGEILARAALAYGSVYRFANVDTQLVGLLEEALERLPPTDSTLRAEVMARLAAARQPDPDPARPIALAHAAIEMAERLDDLSVRAATLRSACSAMVDMAHPSDRKVLDQRHLDLALRERMSGDELQARLRLGFDCMELGDFVSARTHLEQVSRLAGGDTHPQHRWRVPALEVLGRLWRGDLSGIERPLEEARALGDEVGDRNARTCQVMQRSRLLELSGRRTGIDEVADGLGAAFAGSESGERLSRMLRVRFLLQVGRIEEGATAVDRDTVLKVADYSDRTMWLGIAQWAAVTGDARVGKRVLDALEPDAERYVTDGVVGLSWRCSIAMVLAHACVACGEFQRALGFTEQAVRRAQIGAGAPAEAEALALAASVARLLEQHERAEGFRAKCAAICERHGLGGVLPSEERETLVSSGGLERERLERGGLEREASERSGTDVPTFVAEADVWRIRFKGDEIRLRKTKGLGVLAQLVSHPGQAFLAVDLAAPGAAAEVVDVGDAGEVLDAKAVAAYRERAQTLRAELAQAEEHNDLGRTGALKQELASLTEELGRGTALGGKPRRAPGAEERARQAIRKQVRAATDRIGEVHPALGQYLQRAVRTGRTCVYEP